MPDCVKITPANVQSLDWLPHTCAYRLVAFGYDLPRWHHLICGDPERVHTDGPSMRGDLVSEDEVEWPESSVVRSLGVVDFLHADAAYRLRPSPG